MLRKYLPILLFILVIVVSTRVFSDSGSFLIHHDTIYFNNIPLQFSIIAYRDGYEYLMVFTTYTSPYSDEVELIFYFPLPSKPIALDIIPIDNTFIAEVEPEYDRNIIERAFNLIGTYGGVAAAAGGENRGYTEYNRFTSKYFNLSLIGAKEISIDIIQSILKDKGYRKGIPWELEQAIKYYNNIGWKYFILGTVKINKSLTIFQQYVFKTGEIIYPLYIDSINSGYSNINLYIVSDKVVEKYIDPIRSKEKSLDKMFIGINLKIRLKLDSEKDLYRFENSVNKILGENNVKRVFGDMFYVEQGFIKIKGLAYKYRDKYMLSSISNDFKARPGDTRDISRIFLKDIFNYYIVIPYGAVVTLIILYIPALVAVALYSGGGGLLKYLAIVLSTIFYGASGIAGILDNLLVKNPYIAGYFTTINTIQLLSSVILFILAFIYGVVIYRIEPNLAEQTRVVLSLGIVLVLTPAAILPPFFPAATIVLALTIYHILKNKLEDKTEKILLFSTALLSILSIGIYILLYLP